MRADAAFKMGTFEEEWSKEKIDHNEGLET